MKNAGLYLGLCFTCQLALIQTAPVQSVPVPYKARPSLQGVASLVDRIADSPYGLFDPIPAADPSQILDSTGQPQPLWLNPEWTVPAAPAPDRQMESRELRPLIELEAKRNGIDPLLVEAVIRTESSYDPYAVSPVGAQGLMQLMPDTAALVGVANPFDPSQNIAGGTLYLSWQLQTFSGDVNLALAAYNAGPAAVQRWGGIPPYAETVEYVRRVVEEYRLLQAEQATQMPEAVLAR